MRVGWIGLGSMGRPMALAAVRGGHAVRGFARRAEAGDELRAAGAAVLDDPRAAAAGAEIVCVTLFSEAQVRAVVVDGGVLAAMAPGAILAVHSTVSPGFVRELGTVRGDAAVLDAGFSGGPDEALAGRLTLMVGGDGDALERARPVFACYADPIAHLGPPGAGMTLKLINNLLFAANVAAARDGLRLAREAGLAPDETLATLLRGSAGSTALGLIGRGGDPEGVVAAIARYLDKDVGVARANAAGLDLGVLDAATRGFGGA